MHSLDMTNNNDTRLQLPVASFMLFVQLCPLLRSCCSFNFALFLGRKADIPSLRIAGTLPTLMATKAVIGFGLIVCWDLTLDVP